MNIPLMLLMEVMDKEASILRVLLVFVGLGLLGLVLSRKKPLLALPFTGTGLILGARQLGEMSDPYVGPAIRSEAGASYVLLSYVAIVLGVGLPLIGAWLGLARRSKAAAPPSR